jgi:cell division protein FtsB
MGKALQEANSKRPTLRSLSAEIQSLRERVEDLEDARDLEEAIRKNGDKPLIPWEEAKKELGLD